ncbi:iron complex outermembrane receptor protein [Spirosoma oryzae]|uniref:Iron complex outermembrane receptor protein n=1 Tax=Spirosoma oryzae TaxID=1469603 RepID=A0A2T0T0G5_9BACT|nr:TonB-dependent siderophore receptor [Spirosoma oryzae]PRY39165.1 iron complex outermembrane receptor protein [Spirosoma oryzae]
MSKLYLYTLLLCFCSSAVFAQTGGLRGKITSADGNPVEAVTVRLKGTRQGAMSTAEGTYEVKNIKAGEYTLQVSLIGLETKEQIVSVQAGQVTDVPTITLNENTNQLQEVMVTAGRGKYTDPTISSSLRLAAPVIEIPQNIQLVTSKVLADQLVTSMSDGVIRNVSGATKLEHWGDMYSRINARGGRLSAFRNGMNITSSWGPLNEDMSFVDHIEFVKGPAGFMMSNGDPTGIYNVVTKRPTGVTKGEASLLLGSYDFYRASLDLDGKLSADGRLLYRFNAMGQTKNSFRPYEFNNRYSIAPVISYRLSDRTTLTAEYIYQYSKMSNVGSFYVFDTRGYGTLPRDFTFAEPGLDPTTVNDHNLTVNIQHQIDPNWKITAQGSYFNYQQVGSSMWVNSVATNGDVSRYVSIWDASNIMKFGQVYLNGTTRTGGIQHRILAGLDLGSKEYLADWNQSHDLDSAGTFNIYRANRGLPKYGFPTFDRSRSLAQRAGIYGVVSQAYTGAYLQDELGFLDNRIRLTLAGRYTDVRQNSYNTITTGKRFTPRVGLSVSLGPQTAVYALYDQSFVPQAGVRRDGGEVKPVTGNNREIGIKRDWFGGRWSTTLALYSILQNNQNAADPTNRAGEQFVVQFGQTKTQGIEFDLRGEIVRGLNLVANYALTDSKIAQSATESLVGNKVPGYAKHNANAWLSYRVQQGVLRGFGASLGFTYQGDRTTWAWTGATGQQALPDYFKLDGGLFWEKDRFRITANVFNIADTYLYSGSPYLSYYYWQAEPGRNSRVGVTYSF